MSARRTVLLIVGILLILIGAVFALQGANYIGGSSMTGVTEWIYIGGAMFIVGLILIVIGFRSGGSKAPAASDMTGSTKQSMQ